MRVSGNVVFKEGDSAMRAILAVGALTSPEEAPDGFGRSAHRLIAAVFHLLEGTMCFKFMCRCLSPCFSERCGLSGISAGFVNIFLVSMAATCCISESISTATGAKCCAGLTEADVSDVSHLWHKGQGLAKGAIDDFPVHLYFRLATVADVRQAPKHQQRHGQMQVNKCCLMTSYGSGGQVAQLQKCFAEIISVQLSMHICAD